MCLNELGLCWERDGGLGVVETTLAGMRELLWLSMAFSGELGHKAENQQPFLTA